MVEGYVASDEQVLSLIFTTSYAFLIPIVTNCKFIKVIVGPFTTITSILHQFGQLLIMVLTGDKINDLKIDCGILSITSSKQKYPELGLIAGYISSLIWGSVLMVGGFNSVAAKFISAFICLLLVSLLGFQFSMWISKKLKINVGLSINICFSYVECFFASALIGSIVMIWLWNSVILRFLVSFLAVMNLLYPIYDVIPDILPGVKAGEKEMTQSDIMAIPSFYSRSNVYFTIICSDAYQSKSHKEQNLFKHESKKLDLNNSNGKSSFSNRCLIHECFHFWYTPQIHESDAKLFEKIFVLPLFGQLSWKIWAVAHCSVSLAFFIAILYLSYVNLAETLEAARQALLLHNNARKILGLAALFWSPGLADECFSYSKFLWATKTFRHSHGKYGENLFMISSGDASIIDAANSWLDERKNFHGQKIGSGDFQAYGHYTQMVGLQIIKFRYFQLLSQLDVVLMAVL